MTNAVRILRVGWGAEGEAVIPLKGILGSMTGSNCELLELSTACPESKAEAERIGNALDHLAPARVLLVARNGVPVEIVARFFELAKSRRWSMPVIAACPAAQPAQVAELLRLGASEVLTPPFNAEMVLGRLLDPGTEAVSDSPVAQLRARLGLSQIIGTSAAFVAVLRQVPAIAKYDAPVLILGETGTGKEVFARAIHYHSVRQGKPFIPVNSGAIPLDIFENEFFGHEAGAFTSAASARPGVIQEADGGTLFLDEVDCLPSLAQVKLLRFLQDGQFRPLGAQRMLSADVRIVAASNIDLHAAVEQGRFRGDLYHRLNVISLRLPSLREREDDVLLLARHFLAKYSSKFGAQAKEFSRGALFKLASHDWPGNVRELENVIQRAIVLTEETVVPPENVQVGQARGASGDQSFRAAKARVIQEFERGYVRRLLFVHDGNITKAAEAAGKDRRAFWELMRKHGVTARSAASQDKLPRQ